jgi:uncharacterized membrane protein
MTSDLPLFQAVIVPHRSLTPRALRTLLGALLLLSCASAGLAIGLGAWPVCGFTAAALLLAGWLLHYNVRVARGFELIELTESVLRVIRTDFRGVRDERVLAPGWLQVVLQQRHGRTPALLLVSHGRGEEVAASLGEAEKRDLAQALRDALQRWRSPVQPAAPVAVSSRFRGTAT